MLIPQQENDLMAERMLYLSRNKEEVITAFLKECGEHANWEDWLNFLQERAEVKEFEWVLSLKNEFSILKEVSEQKK